MRSWSEKAEEADHSFFFQIPSFTMALVCFKKNMQWVCFKKPCNECALKKPSSECALKKTMQWVCFKKMQWVWFYFFMLNTHGCKISWQGKLVAFMHICYVVFKRSNLVLPFAYLFLSSFKEGMYFCAIIALLDTFDVFLMQWCK